MKNKYQEALEYLISNGTHTTEYSWEDEIETETERGEESVNLLQELVDKETPMKLYCGRKCGKCKFHIPIKSRGDIYCNGCGQKIDWSDEE